MKKKLVGMCMTIIGIVMVITLLSGCTGNEEPELEDCPECPELEDTSHLNRIYDVNRNGRINFQDAGLAWIYVQGRYPSPCWILNPIVTTNDTWNYIICDPMPHNKNFNSYAELLYDVNTDGIADIEDVQLIWQHRD